MQMYALPRDAASGMTGPLSLTIAATRAAGSTISRAHHGVACSQVSARSTT